MNVYKKEIVKNEYIYSEEEQKKLQKIYQELYRLTHCDAFSTSKLSKLVNDLEALLTHVE